MHIICFCCTVSCQVSYELFFCIIFFVVVSKLHIILMTVFYRIYAIAAVFLFFGIKNYVLLS